MNISDLGWMAIRQSVVAIALVCCLVFGYQNGWANEPDFRTVIVTLISLLGADLVATTMKKKTAALVFALTLAGATFGQAQQVQVTIDAFSQTYEANALPPSIPVQLKLKYTPPAVVTPLPVPAPAPVPPPTNELNVLDFGAKPNDNVDDTLAINNALRKARTDNKTLRFPAGVFTHNGLVQVDSARVEGVGLDTVLLATNYLKSSVVLKGNEPSLKSLTVRFNTAGVSRQSHGDTCGVFTDFAKSFTIENVLVDGSPSAGIMSWGSTGTATKPCIVRNCTVKKTLADGIHNTNGAEFIRVEGCTVNSHDDGIAVVSYAGNSKTSKNITILNNVVQATSWGRGIAVSGGEYIEILDNKISNTCAAGLLIVSEGGEWNTRSVTGVTARRNTITNACVDVNGAKVCPTGHPGVLIGGRTGYLVSQIVLSDNTITTPTTDGIRIMGNVRSVSLFKTSFSGIPSNRKPIVMVPEAMPHVGIAN
jgi:hypothetical protein